MPGRMPQLGPSLAAGVPALAKRLSEELDKQMKWGEQWRRTREWMPLITAAIGGGMMYYNRYPEYGRSILDGGIALFTDELVSVVWKPTASMTAFEEARRVAAQRAAQLNAGNPFPGRQVEQVPQPNMVERGVAPGLPTPIRY